MLKAILFGAAAGGKRIYEEVKQKYEVIAFVDNDSFKWGTKIEDINIYEPNEYLKKCKFDCLIITSAPGLETIKQQCLGLGISEDKIITSYIEAPLESRRIFLESLAVIKEYDKDAEVAEAGVFQGDFARYINLYFADRRLHLFDTFEGFDLKDIVKEKGYSSAYVGGGGVRQYHGRFSNEKNAISRKMYCA